MEEGRVDVTEWEQFILWFYYSIEDRGLVQLVLEQQGVEKGVVDVGERTDEGHRLQLVVQLDESEGLGTQILHGAHALLDARSQRRERLVVALAERKQRVVGVESRPRATLDVHGLQRTPHGHWVVLCTSKVRPLLGENCKVELTSSLVSTLPPFPSLYVLLRGRLRLLSGHNGPQTVLHEPGSHFAGPLRVVCGREVGETGSRGWSHGARAGGEVLHPGSEERTGERKAMV